MISDRQAEEIYYNGIEDYWEGDAKCDNPYRFSVEEYEAWLDGWLDAQWDHQCQMDEALVWC